MTDIRTTVDRYTTDSWPIYHRQFTDIPPTVDWYTTDSWPIYHRHMTDSKSRCVVEISTDTRPIVFLTIDRLSTDCWPTIDRYIDRYLGRHYTHSKQDPISPEACLRFFHIFVCNFSRDFLTDKIFIENFEKWLLRSSSAWNTLNFFQ